ncbi:nad binding rossmann fold-containing protein [Colletotrichum asianum]|uniref:Nad binding rossmann fold-containing protein n=1 Tax=Colletotrichum asianum TaxID=702518 RepID=A0A8H3W2V2_9PEZI|nr:nad binding rossmann fold-containing protein [Colletotrichum asianum]
MAGKHVLCEKPLSTNVEESQSVVDTAAERPDLKVVCGFSRRFDDSYRDAYHKVQQGLIGKPIIMRCQSCDVFDPTGGFVSYAEVSGGIFPDASIHDIDLAVWFFGKDSKIKSDADNAIGTLEFHDGGMVSLFASRTMSGGAEDSTEIIGTKGKLVVNQQPSINKVQLYQNGGIFHEMPQNYWERFHDAFVVQAINFTAGILDGGQPPIELQSAAEVVKIGVALQESMRTGKKILFDGLGQLSIRLFYKTLNRKPSLCCCRPRETISIVMDFSSSAGKPFRVGVVGYGFAAKIFHIPFIRTSPWLELQAIVQRHPTSQSSAPVDHPEVKHYLSAEELVEDSSCDIVVITTPHYDLAKLCLEARKHILVEKPFVSRLEDADHLIKLASDVGRLICVYQNRRFDGDFLTVQKLVQDGIFGRIHEIDTHFDYYRPDSAKSWRGQLSTTEGGGALFDLGSHLIDQAYTLFGLPSSVYGHGMIVNIRISDMSVESPQRRFWIRGTKASYKKDGMNPQEAQVESGPLPTSSNFGVERAGSEGRLVIVRKDGTIEELSHPSVRSKNYGALYQEYAEAICSGNEDMVPVPALQAREVLRILKSVAEDRLILKLWDIYSIGFRGYNQWSMNPGRDHLDTIKYHLPRSLKRVSIFENTDKCILKAHRWLKPLTSGVWRSELPILGCIFAKRSLDFEKLSIAFLIDSNDFFQSISKSGFGNI